MNSYIKQNEEEYLYMGRKNKYGKCRICGRVDKLTFEHVPPGSTYNKSTARYVTVKDMYTAEQEGALPWELNKAKGKIIQRGKGDYYLCEGCNNKTGSWYGSEYKRFVDTILYVRTQCEDNCIGISIELKNIKLLQVFKQIMAMFCDINEGLSEDCSIKEFILDKYSQDFNTNKYRVSMYIMRDGIERTAPFMAQISLGNPNVTVMSEISAIPIGFILYKNYNADSDLPAGTEITWFSTYAYDDSPMIKLDLNIYSNNSWLPADFRSKNEILETIENNKRWEEEHKDLVEMLENGKMF